MNGPLNDAVQLAGGETQLLQKMRPHLPPGSKVDRGHLYYWRTKAKGGVPGEFCRAIAAAVNDEVPVWRLRPDIFSPDSAVSPVPVAEASNVS